MSLPVASVSVTTIRSRVLIGACFVHAFKFDSTTMASISPSARLYIARIPGRMMGRAFPFYIQRLRNQELYANIHSDIGKPRRVALSLIYVMFYWPLQGEIITVSEPLSQCDHNMAQARCPHSTWRWTFEYVPRSICRSAFKPAC